METEEIRRKKGEEELRYLLQWIVKNPDDWRRICDPNFFQMGIPEILKLIERLEGAGLQTVAYIFLNYADYESREMDAVRTQIISETMAELSIPTLMERVKKNLREQIS